MLDETLYKEDDTLHECFSAVDFSYVCFSYRHLMYCGNLDLIFYLCIYLTLCGFYISAILSKSQKIVDFSIGAFTYAFARSLILDLCEVRINIHNYGPTKNYIYLTMAYRVN